MYLSEKTMAYTTIPWQNVSLEFSGNVSMISDTSPSCPPKKFDEFTLLTLATEKWCLGVEFFLGMVSYIILKIT